jgi:hypothetical protein
MYLAVESCLLQDKDLLLNVKQYELKSEYVKDSNHMKKEGKNYQ